MSTYQRVVVETAWMTAQVGILIATVGVALLERR